MTRTLFPGLCLAASMLLAAPAWAGDIFRHVNISGGRLELGRASELLGSVSDKVAPNTYGHHSHAFKGAEAITAVTDAEGVIREFRFEYSRSYDFAKTRAQYEKSFGPPASIERIGDEEAVTWKDGRTELILARKAEGRYASSLILRDMPRK